MSSKDFKAEIESSTPALDSPFTNMGKSATTKRRYTKKAPAGEEEAARRMSEMRTQGREGCKMPRLCTAFTPENYDYLRTVATMSGITTAKLINEIIAQYRETHRDLYDKAVQLRELIQ